MHVFLFFTWSSKICIYMDIFNLYQFVSYGRRFEQGWNYVLIWRQDPLENNSPVGKEFSCRKIILLDRRTTTGHWTLTLTLPRTPWSLRTLPSATREISSGSHRTANYRSSGRHWGDSLCYRQGFPDKKWELIKLGKILPFHGKVTME